MIYGRTLSLYNAACYLPLFGPQSFLSDDDSANYFEDGSWLDAEELTKVPRSEGVTSQGGLINTNYNDEDGEQIEMGHVMEKSALDKTSNF